MVNITAITHSYGLTNMNKKKVLFIGDSFTSGENNNFRSFVDYFKEYNKNLDVIKQGISGTTMGEYSLYPVDGDSLISILMKKRRLLTEVDEIYLEYGINDAAAICCMYTDFNRVAIDFLKCIDFITQTNPKAKIKFISLSSDLKVIEQYADIQCNYLNKEYIASDYIYASPERYVFYYNKLIDFIQTKIDVVTMIDTIAFFNSYLDTDNVHPTNEGYKIIAEKLSSC